MDNEKNVIPSAAKLQERFDAALQQKLRDFGVSFSDVVGGTTVGGIVYLTLEMFGELEAEIFNRARTIKKMEKTFEAKGPPQ